MSYDPSQVLGTRAIQIDLDASSVLSDDITTHTATAILATPVYLSSSVISIWAPILSEFQWVCFSWWHF